MESVCYVTVDEVDSLNEFWELSVPRTASIGFIKTAVLAKKRAIGFLTNIDEGNLEVVFLGLHNPEGAVPRKAATYEKFAAVVADVDAVAFFRVTVRRRGESFRHQPVPSPRTCTLTRVPAPATPRAPALLYLLQARWQTRATRVSDCCWAFGHGSV